MFGQKKISFSNPQLNEGYEHDILDNANTGTVGTFRLTDIGSPDTDVSTIIDDFGRNEGAQRNFGLDGSTHHLSGIREEYSTDDRSSVDANHLKVNDNEKSVRFGIENMSISNFKKFEESNDESREKKELGREQSVGSMINMKEFTPNPLIQEIQTGTNFRKTSTFVITPKQSMPSFGGGFTDEMIRSDREDELNIKFVDNKNIPELFIEFDALQFNPSTDSYIWVEKSRWLKYEEDYNAELHRFDNPHLSPTSVRGLYDFKTIFSQGQVILDCHNTNYLELLNTLCDGIIRCPKACDQELNDIRNILVRRHYHAGEHFPSSTALDRNYRNESAKYRYDPNTHKFADNENSNSAPAMSRKRSRMSFVNSEGLHYSKKISRARLDDRLEDGTESLSVQVGAIGTLKHVYSLFVRLSPPIYEFGINEVNCPIRFIYLLLGPKYMEQELLEVGRCFSVMMSHIKFREVAYSAVLPNEIVDATKIFLQHSVILPLPKTITTESVTAMITQLRLYTSYFINLDNKIAYEQFRREIKKKKLDEALSLNQVTPNGLQKRVSISAKNLSEAHLQELNRTRMVSVETMTTKTVSPVRNVCSQFCPPFYRLFRDLGGFCSRYRSDFVDAFHKDNVGIVCIGVFFIYFVVLSPAITFGALLSNVVSQKMSVSLCLVSCGAFQTLNVLISGQPLEIIGITAPLFVVEKVLKMLSETFAVQLEIMRFWIGIYISILGFVFSFCNGSMVIMHFRRSVEEVFNFFVGAIFLISALVNMFKALPYVQVKIEGNMTNITALSSDRLKFGWGGTTLFLAFLMVNFCLILVKLKRGSFFRRQIRNLLGSFNVPLGILLVYVLERIFFTAYQMPTLAVPPSNDFNVSTWWNPPPFLELANADSKVHGFCFLIAISVFCIMITEISTNSISVTKVERKMKKPSLYSMNYFAILVIYPIISAFLGWPYVSGAMVRSNAHCVAMAKWSTNNLPGVPPKVTGAVEQRFSGLIVGILVFLSVFLGSILRYIPLAAMYGMFLYMGVMGVRDLVVTRRLLSLMQRRKHWDIQSDYLKDYPTWNIIILVVIQFFFIFILISLQLISDFTLYSWTALIFPLFVGIYGLIRGYVMPLWPRLNKHLSKMDKKHPVKLYNKNELTNQEQLVVTLDDKGVDIHVEAMNLDEGHGHGHGHNHSYLDDDDDDDDDNDECCKRGEHITMDIY